MTRQEAASRAAALVAKMTVAEKISQLVNASEAVDRLGVHAYNWWNEALHGVARAGTATVFPQAIGMAASFDAALLGRVAAAIADEGRAKYNESVRSGDYGIYRGLTYWSPNVNIFRDPRWGRGQETYGEDPFLTAAMGTAFVRGLQGDGPFLKAAACAKHFAVHSGPEALRHEFDAKVGMQDLWETYLPAFEALVTKAGVESVMGAYNRVNGEPCCAHSYLLERVLRGKWKFAGHVVSDCGAITDIHEHHHVTKTTAESAALALKRGCDLNCGSDYYALTDAWEQDMVEEADIDRAAVRLFTTRFLLGEFEEHRPFADIPFDRVDCEEYRALNLRMAEESLVLLKNANHFLPLGAGVRRIAVVGPNADSRAALRGNYYGTPSESCTVLEGVRRVFPEARLLYAEGSGLAAEEAPNAWSGQGSLLTDAVSAARNADVTIACVGLDESVEGEENGAGFNGDRSSLFLPKPQQRLLEALCEATDNLVVAVLCGGSIDIGEKARRHSKAVLQAWYPGARGGEAVAELLAGRFSPSGRLPVTFYRGDAELGDFTDYSMEGRTYRFLKEPPLYPFGFGLSYTSFEYSRLTVEPDETGYRVCVDVANTGGRDGREIVQVYARLTDSRFRTPRFQLCGVRPVDLKAGACARVTVTVPVFWLSAVDEAGRRVPPEHAALYVGGHQPDGRSRELGCPDCLSWEG